MMAEQNISNLSGHAGETARGDRFEFGKNWSQFLELLDANRISEAEASLKQMLDVESLEGRSFIDIGSGKWFVQPCGAATGSASAFIRLRSAFRGLYH